MFSEGVHVEVISKEGCRAVAKWVISFIKGGGGIGGGVSTITKHYTHPGNQECSVEDRPCFLRLLISVTVSVSCT